ncbi:MAG: hypothetical protein KDA79_03130 [Planctomycetaceae bacterium]|nr:hypothetical protein [Planctomycetaceae bacterium]
MVESLIALTITTMAGAALLTALSGAVQSSTAAARTQIASGLAAQLMEEITAVRFPDANATPSGGSSRDSFDDLDDYHNWSAQPPRNREGLLIGREGSIFWGVHVERPSQLRPASSFMERLRREVQVEKVQLANIGRWEVTSTETGWRRVRVTVSWVSEQNVATPLAERIQLFSRPAETP